MDNLVGKTFIVNVTDEDINLGCEKDANNCPIARAFNRNMKDVFGHLYKDDSSIGGTSSIIFRVDTIPEETLFLCCTDKSIHTWINDFDSGRDVKPIDIELFVNDKSTIQLMQTSDSTETISVPLFSCNAMVME